MAARPLPLVDTVLVPPATADRALPDADRLARARAALAAASAAPVAMADERVVPVVGPLADLLPHRGLVRGQAVTCRGSAAWSLALSLAAEATRTGSWLMVVGLSGFGVQAAAEAGVALERTVVVAAPPPDQWAVTLGAAVDGVDLVLAPAGAGIPTADARRVHARLRTRGAVLVLVDTGAGPDAAIVPDLDLSTTVLSWEGIGQGEGRLLRRRVAVEVAGRRARAARRRDVHLPDDTGRLAVVSPAPMAIRPAPTSSAGCT